MLVYQRVQQKDPRCGSMWIDVDCMPGIKGAIPSC